MNFDDLLFQGWSGILRTLIVGTMAYVTLVLFLRISGKRTLAKLNAFDLVITVALGSTLSSILLQESIALAEGVTALALLIGLQFLVTFVSVRSKNTAKLIRAEPTLLARRGTFCLEAMRKERITEDEVLSAVRSNGHNELGDVQAVVLESDGSLSVIKSLDYRLPFRLEERKPPCWRNCTKSLPNKAGGAACPDKSIGSCGANRYEPAHARQILLSRIEQNPRRRDHAHLFRQHRTY